MTTPSRVRLVPMTSETYTGYYARSIRDYAQDQVAAGTWLAEDALERSRAVFEKLLPQGLETPKNQLFTIAGPDGQGVGILWICYQEENGQTIVFIYDFMINEDQRRHGYGQAALLALEALAREAGAAKILLHVFGHNHAARALYQKAGFSERNVMMVKNLSA